MSTAQAAEYFGVHIKTILRWINGGKVSAEKIDGHWHVHIKEHDAPHKEQNAPDTVHHLEELLERADSEIVHLREQNVHYREQVDHLTQVVAMSQKNIASLTEQLDTSRAVIEDFRRRPWWKRLFYKDMR